MNQKRVLVVGGGIIGIAAAHYLSRDGHRVTVMDRGQIGGACSKGNCGLVCPSHVLPLAEPGMAKQTIRALLDPNGALKIRPRLDRAFWRWLWNFWRRCNERDMMQSGRAIQPLLASSMSLYQQLVSEDRLECEWQKQGLLFVYQTAAAFESYSSTNQLLADRFNEPAQRLAPQQLADFAPTLKQGLAGGWYFEHDAHLRPDRLIASWKLQLERSGVVFLEHTSLRGIDEGAEAVTATDEAGQSYSQDAVVIATGAWTPRLAEILRFRVPIEPGKGYSITVPRPSDSPRVPMIFPEHRVAVTPMDSAMRIGSIMEFAGYDETINPRRLRLLTDGVSHYLRQPLPQPISDQWYGWRPMTYDSKPVIGRCPGFQQVYLATGHNMLGLSMAPATGRLVSELVSEHRPHVDPEPYRAERFVSS